VIRAFIDASVLFAACYSPTGASREIIRYALRGQLFLAASELVLAETERNISEKAPQSLEAFRRFRDAVSFELVRPTKREILAAAKYTKLKDAPIVAAAKKAKANFLVTLDRKHLLADPQIAKRSGLKIVLPEHLLNTLKRTA
jgi:predicted nucleic acid-binding protein